MADNSKQNVAKASEDAMKLSDYIGLFLPRWYWFVISVVVTMAMAILYLAMTPNVYTRTAELLVKDDKKGRSAIQMASDEFANMGLFASNTNITNEITTLKSPEIMTEVVKRLRLNENYSIKQGLKTVTLYKKQPVDVYFKGNPNTAFSMKIELTDENNFRITDYTTKDVEGLSFTGKIGNGVKTPDGIIALSRSKYFSKDMIGVQFNYSHGIVSFTADAYATRLSAELSDKNGTIVKLTISDESAQRAEDVINTLINVYNENWVMDKNRISVSTSKFIGERLRVIEGELGSVDANISSFKSENLVPDLAAASQMYMQQSAESKKEMMGISTQLATAEFMRRELAKKDITQALPTNSGIDNTSITSGVGEYNAAVLDRNRLLASSSESNPLVQDLANKLHSLKQTILQSVDNYIASLRQQMGGAQRIDAVATGKLASNPNQAKYLLSVERQQKVKEALYLFLLQKREENELSQAFTAYNTRVITAPRGSANPTSPQKANIMLIAFALGLAIPAGIIIVGENMNTKVRGKKDLESISVPLVGEIPLYIKPKTVLEKASEVFAKKKKTTKDRKTDLVIAEGKRDMLNEAFRVLRSNIDFMSNSDENRKVILMTSFNPGSGKSFISINLACSFAIKGKKVLVIDGDLRHGSASAYVGSPKTGLIDYLSGKVKDVDGLILPLKEYPSLNVLPIGKVPPNPTELLENGRLGEVIEAMRSKYDLIVLDCPPIDIVADTQIIEKYADRTVFIIRAGLLERAMLKDLEEIYTTKRFKNLTLILNGTESSGGRYSYRYGYRYGYKYGYKYGYGSKSYYTSE